MTKKQIFTTTIIGILSGVIIFLSPSAWRSYRVARAEQTAESFAKHIVDSKYTEAYDQVTDSFKDAYTKDAFIQEYSPLATNAGVTSETFPQPNLDDEGMLIIVVIDGLPETIDGRTDAKFFVTVTNENGWKVRSVRVT